MARVKDTPPCREEGEEKITVGSAEQAAGGGHASELLAEGVDIGIISKQLGHRTIATTARYLDHIAPYAVIEALHGRRW